MSLEKKFHVYAPELQKNVLTRLIITSSALLFGIFLFHHLMGWTGVLICLVLSPMCRFIASEFIFEKYPKPGKPGFENHEYSIFFDAHETLKQSLCVYIGAPPRGKMSIASRNYYEDSGSIGFPGYGLIFSCSHLEEESTITN